MTCVKLRTFSRHQSNIQYWSSSHCLKNCPLQVLICAFQKDTSKSATLRKSLVPAGSSCDEMKGVYFVTFYASGSNDWGHIVIVLSVCLIVSRLSLYISIPLMMPFWMTSRSMTLWPCLKGPLGASSNWIVRLSVYLSIHLSVCLSICLSVILSRLQTKRNI